MALIRSTSKALWGLIQQHIGLVNIDLRLRDSKIHMHKVGRKRRHQCAKN
jgi:hypothetical protein